MKITIDAYNGIVDFYLMNSGDPIMTTFRDLTELIQTIHGHACKAAKNSIYQGAMLFKFSDGLSNLKA